MRDFTNKLSYLISNYGLQKIRPVSSKLISSVSSELGPFSDDLRDFYNTTNGLTFGWLTIFPLKDKDNIKHTWNSLQRANDVSNSKHLGGDPHIFKRFLIIADIDGDNCAVMDRNDFSIWYEEKGALHQTDMTLIQFIETMLFEVSEQGY